MSNYLDNAVNAETPQAEKLRDDQVPNQAGGFVWAVDKWQALRRFLILGTEGGSYYASEHKQTFEQTQNLDDCIADNGSLVVGIVADISTGGKAAKNDPAIFALARVLSRGDEKAKGLAIDAVPAVCRTGTHIFTLARFLKAQRGTGRVFRKAIASWYEGKDNDKLAYQLVKYRQRDGWTHADLLRLSHANLGDNDTVRYLAKDVLLDADAKLPKIAEGYRKIAETPAHKRAALIREYGLPREALPTEWLQDVSVWDALIDSMPITALIRNLGVMTANGSLQSRKADIIYQITDAEALKKGRVHPIQILAALTTYRTGHGVRGSLSWNPVSTVADALDDAFYMTFDNVEPTGKPTLLALDVSGSMGWGVIAGVPGLTPRMGAAAMAMVTARTEPDYQIMAFGHKFVPLNITAKDSLDAAVGKTANLSFGGTDCALPMLYAKRERLNIETFVVYTDSETWYGQVHPAQALQNYRKAENEKAKLAVVAMVANGFSIADPHDAGMMDFVGFDTGTPQALTEFATL